jgi:Domain of Unknown Function (DUF1080).
MKKITGNPIYSGITTVAVLIILILSSILINPMPAQVASAASILSFGGFIPAQTTTANKTSAKTAKKTPPPNGIFTDKFTNPASLAANWQIVDAKVSWGGPSSWTIKNGMLVQNSGIFYNGKNRFQILEGTNIISKNPEPEQFTYSVEFNTKMGKEGVGVLFHYIDEQHYYRFVTVQNAASGGPFRMLQSKVEGNFVTLAQNKQGYDPGKAHKVMIKVANDTITVYFDGKKQFSAPSGHDTANGHVGLQTYANHVGFDNLQVTR